MHSATGWLQKLRSSFAVGIAVSVYKSPSSSKTPASVTAWFKDNGRPEAACLGRSFVYSSMSATVRGIRAAFGLRVFS